jgi:hypothetical protein
MTSRIVRASLASFALVSAASAAGCGSSDTPVTGLISSDDKILTTALIKSLDSAGQAIAQANPTNRSIQTLVDSTLTILMAGISSHRIDVSTDLTTNPLFFVGVHRVYNRSGVPASATWNIVGMDDPSKLGNMIEFGGFAQGTGGIAPESLTGTIGDGSGVVNGELIQVAGSGASTIWSASSGSVSIVTDPGTTPCTGFTGVGKVTCTLETVRVQFTLTSTGAVGATGGRHAATTTIAMIPTMRLTYSP